MRKSLCALVVLFSGLSAFAGKTRQPQNLEFGFMDGKDVIAIDIGAEPIEGLPAGTYLYLLGKKNNDVNGVYIPMERVQGLGLSSVEFVRALLSGDFSLSCQGQKVVKKDDNQTTYNCSDAALVANNPQKAFKK